MCYNIILTMIWAFRCKETEKLFRRELTRKFPDDIKRTAGRKLQVLNAAMELSQLRTPAGNRLEMLSGGRKAQHSIRINKQWRICFRWEGGNAYDVEIVDYH